MARKNGNVESKEVALAQEQANEVEIFAPSDKMPDFLTGDEKSGMEALDSRADFKIPEIKLLQPLSPEVKTYQGIAIPGEYWHTGLMKSLGKSYLFTPIIIKKQVLLWRPKNDQGGGIIARSSDCINWDMGANTRFTVKLKDIKDPVVWDTKRSVRESGLLNFGTSNPDNEQSTPAAVLYYEYLEYLHGYENASPVIQRAFKTGVDSAKAINGYFLLHRPKPVYVHVIKAFIDEKAKDGNEWFIPKFSPNGFVPNKELFDSLKSMVDQYSDYEVEIEQPDVEFNKNNSTMDEAIKDEVPY